MVPLLSFERNVLMSETPSAAFTSSVAAATPIPNNYGVATSMADVQNQINEMEAFF